ncbi:MAG TPA: NAD(P)H-dependent oxidoreductase [Flavobacteriales bacterium]|jgi:chromate reductase
MKIIAFGASHHKASINKTFAAYAASLFESAEVEVLDLNNYPLPMFTVEAEEELGHPQAAHDFVAKLDEADLLIISMSEHNGSYTASFKNLFDWASRVKLKMFEGKKLLLISTATGSGAGVHVLETARKRFPRHGAEIIGTFSLPRFNDNFNEREGILVEDLRNDFMALIEHVKSIMSATTPMVN